VLKVRCPVLLLHGEKDGMVPIEESQKLFEAMTRARGGLSEQVSPDGGLPNHAHATREVKLVRFPLANHRDVFSFPQWLTELHEFIAYCEARQSPNSTQECTVCS
jgi:fermentation-respiration switch protein FrsA (DUF1100 family)